MDAAAVSEEEEEIVVGVVAVADLVAAAISSDVDLDLTYLFPMAWRYLIQLTLTRVRHVALRPWCPIAVSRPWYVDRDVGHLHPDVADGINFDAKENGVLLDPV